MNTIAFRRGEGFNSHIKFTNVGKYPIGTKVRHKDKFNDPQEKEWYKKEYFIAKYNQFGVAYLTSLDGYPLWNHNGGIGAESLIKVEDVMGFDMSQCKKGDKLVCRDGVVAEYVGKHLHSVYTHKVMVKDVRGNWPMSTTSTGERFEGQTSNDDIIGFYKEEVVVNKQEIIERNKEYDLKVTGEQLAILMFFTKRSCNTYNLYDNLRKQYSESLFGQIPESKTNGVGWDSIYRDEVNAWLNNIFKTPETEKEKNLRELKEKHEELGKAIKKLEQSN